VEIDQIADCQAVLIVNRVAHRLRLAEIRRLIAGATADVAPSNQKPGGAD
jgi:hypothetical protein